MASFEQDYYESERFWQDGAIEDEGNIRRFNETAALVPEQAKSLVDIGCGNGLFLNHLQVMRPDMRLMGIDRSVTALQFVRFEKAQGDIAEIPLEDRSFDCVSCLEVIEHLPIVTFEKALAELSRISKRYIIVSVPLAEILEENYTKCPRCKTSFNADLHLRNFSETDMQSLLVKHGYKMVTMKKTGERVKYKGHYQFRKIFHRKQFTEWRSPICPVCGYREETIEQKKQAAAPATATVSRNGFVSYFTALPKLFWPKERKYYWVICLYEKSNGK